MASLQNLQLAGAGVCATNFALHPVLTAAVCAEVYPADLFPLNAAALLLKTKGIIWSWWKQIWSQPLPQHNFAKLFCKSGKVFKLFKSRLGLT